MNFKNELKMYVKPQKKCITSYIKFMCYFVGLLLPERVKIAIMSFLAITIGYIMRACLSIAITQMVQPPIKGSATVCPIIMQMRLVRIYCK